MSNIDITGLLNDGVVIPQGYNWDNEKEIDMLRSVLFDIMWSMWHQPEYFDELLEGETK